MKDFNSPTVVNSIISDILFALSLKRPINIKQYSPRFNILYYPLFELAPSRLIERFKEEVLECELYYLKLRPYENYQNITVTSELVISMYMDVAHTLALLKILHSQSPESCFKNFICAEYLKKNLSLLLEGGLIADNVKSRFCIDIQNAFFNFRFATGFIEREDCVQNLIFKDIALKSVADLQMMVSKGTNNTAMLKKKLSTIT